MNKKIIWGIVAIVIIIVLVAIGSNKKEATPVGSKESIKIGAIISQSGAAASFGEMAKYGIDLAVNEINSTGGIDGRSIVVVYGDDQTDPKAAVGLYQKLTTIDHVDGIIGSNFDFVTGPIFAVASTSDTVVISPSNPRIAGVFDTNVNSFVMLSDFSKIVADFRSYLNGHPYKQLAVAHFTSGFAAEIVKGLDIINKDLGRPAIVDEPYKQIGNNDFRTIIAKLKQANADLVFLDMVGPDPLTFLSQAKQLGYKPQIITHVGIQAATEMKGVDLSIFDGVVVLNWNVSTQEFAQKFNKVYHVDPTNSANTAYDAVYILSRAIADTTANSQVAPYIAKTTFATPNNPKVSFTSGHAVEHTPVEIDIIKNGELVPYQK